MRLGEFIKNFSHNNVVRLHYKIKGGYQCVLDDWDDVSMDHEIINGKGKNRHYVNNEVLGLTTIYFHQGHSTTHPDALNIVIEKLDNQPFVKEVVEEHSYFESYE